jgi:voltage-gated potassium channel
MAGEQDSADAPRLLRILEGRRLSPRRALQLIALLTFAVTLVGALLAWLIDRNEFSSLGESFWWALQTVTTVGYGDVVPAETDGRVIGVILMLQGIGLITVVAAVITATLLEQARTRRERPPAQLDRIEQRLAAAARQPFRRRWPPRPPA